MFLSPLANLCNNSRNFVNGMGEEEMNAVSDTKKYGALNESSFIMCLLNHRFPTFFESAYTLLKREKKIRYSL